MSTQYLALIPARYGSTRFPGKPLAKIQGKPMIQHVYEKSSAIFSHTFVATDDQRIAAAVNQFGGKYIMTSDKHQSGTDRCAEALETAEKETGLKFHVVVNIQGDEPFIAPEQLQLIASCFDDTQTHIATLVKQIDKQTDLFDTNKPKVVVASNGRAIYFSRTPIPYLRNFEESHWLQKHRFYKHIGLYAYRSHVLREITQLPQSPLELAESLEQLRWIENGYSISTKVTETENMAVDTPADLKQIEDMLNNSGKNGYWF